MSDRCTPQALLEAAVGGDLAALEQLLLSHFSALERHIEPRLPPSIRRQASAEDILQEVFVRAFRDIGQFQNRYESSFLAWLKAIADHRTADAIRHAGRKKRGGDHHRLSKANMAASSNMATLIDIVCHDSHVPDDSAIRHEMDMAMHVALASLPDPQREALCAHYFLNKDVEVIAREMGRTTGAVRGLIDRGKKKLATAMGRSSRWYSGN